MTNRGFNAASVPTLVLLSTMAAACTGATSQASLVVGDQGVRVTIRRVAIHPFLAEYKRWLVVEQNTRPPAEMEMEVDTGGGQHVKVYPVGPGLLFLRDCFGAYQVDLGGRITGLGVAPTPTDALFIGAFDRDATGFLGAWRFIPAAERPEQPILGDTASQ